MTDQHQHLGKYDILDKLGEGGFGAVYRAVDTALDRPVALKLLKPMLLADPVFLLRFRREAKAAAGLDHPNIVSIYDFGEVEGSYYLAMRYISGESLDKLIAREGPLPVARVLKIAGQIAAALDYAHGHGLLHRDVKPSNIIIGDGDHAYLTDFGLVRSVENSALTSASQVVGTAEYMAPEQLDTDRQDEVGPRTDLYAFGIVVYQMLAGRVPFSGSISAVIGSQLYKQPLSSRSLRPDLPPAIDAALLQMLSKQSAERFGSGQAFVAAMEGAEEKARQEAGRARRGAETAAAVATLARQRAEAAARAESDAEQRARQDAEARGKAEDAARAKAEGRTRQEVAEQARYEAELKAQDEVADRRVTGDADGHRAVPAPIRPAWAGPVAAIVDVIALVASVGRACTGSTATPTLTPVPPTATRASAVPTALPTATARPIPPNVTSTSTALPTATVANTPTQIPPTTTPVPTATLPPTATVAPTSAPRFNAVTLVSPGDGDQFDQSTDTVELRWEQLPGLPTGAQYVAMLSWTAAKWMSQDIKTVQTQAQLGKDKYRNQSDDGKYTWCVCVQNTENSTADRCSTSRTFIWKDRQAPAAATNVPATQAPATATPRK